MNSREKAEDAALRPTSFDDYIGQDEIKDNLRVMIAAARQRGDALDHLLLCGPPGLGKTSLSNIIATELGVGMKVTTAPMLTKKADLIGILTSLNEGDVLFIDEIHRMPMPVEENLYPAMEDYKFDFVVGAGATARTTSIPLPKFTLVGATTRAGMLSQPLRDRFGFIGRMDFYGIDDLCRIAQRSAGKLGVSIDPEGAEALAKRARNTPRLVNRLMRRVRDYAQVYADGQITAELAEAALDRIGIDQNGFDEMDRRYLDALVNRFGGGPVGLDTMAGTIGEDPGTIEDTIEPYLLKEGFLSRGPRGRAAGPKAYEWAREARA